MKKTTYHVGIDLHKEVVQTCVLDAQGENAVYERVRLGSPEDGLAFVRSLERWKTGGRFAVEALGMNRWLVNACRERGLDIVVCDAAKLCLKRSGKKTDRRDAFEIARRLYLGDIDRDAKTYYPTEEEYAGRKLVRVRHKMTQMRLCLVNNLRAFLRAYNLGEPAGTLETPTSLEWLRRVRFEHEDLTASFNALVETLEGIQAQIEALSTQIKAKTTQSRRVSKEGQEKPRSAPSTSDRIQLLARELPQVGAQTAATIVYELGDVSRFRHTRAVAAYAGLVPRVANSADTSHHGPLTKHGSSELRWILSQWAVRLLAKDERVQNWAAPRLRRMHKNKVRVALARRLLIGTYRMLRHGEVFSLDRCLRPAA